jgi:drug/metabolite transporter (DMT)-like permease
MGLGDLAQFGALPRLGSRLTVLMTQCLAAPLSALAEWLWLGTRITTPQALWGFVILGGVAIALMPSRARPPRVRLKPLGFVFGFLAAAGQGLGAVVSRKAGDVAAAAGESVDPITAAYQRILAGFGVALVFTLLVTALKKGGDKGGGARNWRDYLWIPANGLAGAVLGVTCYQWALASTASGVVLAIVATTPLVIIPLSYWIEGERPTQRSLVGGVIAVGGAVALVVVSASR